VPDHLEVPRDVIENLSNVLANLAHLAAAARAVQLGSCRMSRGGRCTGSLRRSDFLRSSHDVCSIEADCSPRASGASSTAPAPGASACSCPSLSSSCSLVRVIFSDERPNCMRRSHAPRSEYRQPALPACDLLSPPGYYDLIRRQIRTWRSTREPAAHALARQT